MISRTFVAVAAAFLSSGIAAAQSTLRIELGRLPDYHPEGADIYAAGSFNGWNPADPAFRFHKDLQGIYALEIALVPGSYEYKLTRGNWEKAECSKEGEAIPNRSISLRADTSIVIAVEEWADRFPAPVRRSTASHNVTILDTAFVMPQLKRTRRIWVCLPPGYSDHPQQRYPVLYLQDGQNLFDNATAYAGEWGIDEFLDTTKLPPAIIVGIDHGDAKRLNEYNPYDNDRFGKGEGRLYLGFLVNTLKPYIDLHYRTRTGRQHTFIAGSSMGGLISLYAVLAYPETFGGTGVLSPAFWITGGRIFEEISQAGRNRDARIFLYAGEQEGETMVPDMKKAATLLKRRVQPRISMLVDKEGKHTEAAWQKVFPSFYRWMLAR